MRAVTSILALLVTSLVAAAPAYAADAPSPEAGPSSEPARPGATGALALAIPPLYVPQGGEAGGEAPAGVTRFGLRSLGLSLEVPMVGVLGVLGVGGKTNTSYGYTLGGALSWEVVPGLLVRGYTSFGKSYGARAALTWKEPDGTKSGDDKQASYWGLELGGGLAWVFRDVGRDWEPFVGADAGASFGGYQYTFEVNDPLAQRDPNAQPVKGTSPDVHEALDWSWLATVRVGMRLSMLSWLGSQLDVGLSYWPSPSHAVSNTYTSRYVTSVGQDVWLVRSTFTVRLGI